MLTDGVRYEIDLFLTCTAQLHGGGLVATGSNELVAAYLKLFDEDGRCGVVRSVGMLVENVDSQAVDGRLGYTGGQLVAVGFT